jgi:hypothetical protein
MVSILMMQATAIHPGDRIDIDSEDVIHDGDEFEKPFPIVEGTMRDSQMKNIGQIQPAKKPAKDKIRLGDQHSSPSSQMSWGEIQAGQHVRKNNQITDEIVNFHGTGSVGLFKQRKELP